MDHTQDYRFAPAVALRLVGAVFVVLGLIAAVVVALVAAGVLSGGAFGPTLLIIALVVVAVAGVGLMAVTRLWVLRLLPDGYRTRFIRGVGVPQARWADVERMATTHIEGAACLVLQLKSGKSTTIPVAMLAGDREELVRELSQRLVRR